jgi:endonuclease/exonuclease/phosphatase (EEP) superfamily protein YafD
MSQQEAIRLSIFAGSALLIAAALAQNNQSPSPSPSMAETRDGASARHSFTVAFWNIQWFPGGRPDATAREESRQIEAVHSTIKRIRPDVVGMEEVRDFAKAGLAVQPLNGFKVDVCANFPPREGQNQAQEVAIASRLQPMSAWTEQWKPAGAATPPRGFAFAAYQLQPGRVLLLYCVHLKSNYGEIAENVPIRQESVRQLLSHQAAMEDAYKKLGKITCVIGGDFNTSLDDPRFKAEQTLRELMNHGFLWAWQNVPLSSRLTLPGTQNFPAACFDHIFYRGATLKEAFVVNTPRQASDHRAIVAVFDL